jgi:hypothetical protein
VAAILDQQASYLGVEDPHRNIKNLDMVPGLSHYNLQALQTNEDFMLKHGYIQNDVDVFRWAAPEFLEQAAGDSEGGVEAAQ